MARQLTLAGQDYGYEDVKIDYLRPARTSKYNPDFTIKKKDGTTMFIEGKGRFLTEDRQKHVLIRDQHPDIDIRFVFSNANAKIGKTSATTYRKWCSDKGFKFGDKGVIPKEWYDE
jgi:hypothetical protein